MALEIELKFRAKEDTLQTLRRDIAAEEKIFHMHTTYYDTPDSALSGRHYTLRRRMENDRSVCTLKTPTSGIGRGEFEVLCDSIEAAIPKLCKLSGVAELEALTARGLQEVCGARFTRIAKTFTWQGTTMELALDQGELYGGGKTIPLWEVEVELKAGEEATLRAYGAFLSAAYGLVPEKASKFRRGLALYKGE